MPTVSRTFSVSPSPHQVIEYLKDFAHAVEWDPGTQQCTRNDGGPIGEGASWHNVSKIAGITAELTYTLETMSDSNLVFVGKNKSSTSTENIYVDTADTGSVITYRNDLEIRGPIALLNPLLKLYFEKLANDTEKQMISVLNRLYIEEKK